MHGYLDMSVEIVVGFICLLLLTKLLGKTQITSLTAIDFIGAIVLAELVGNALFDPKAGVFKIIYAIFIWGALLYVTEIITQKFKVSRSFLEGKPSIIIHNGFLIRDEMKKNKLDINQLQHLLRAKDAFSIQDVEYAILETDGTISILKKSDKKAPTRQDLNLPQTVINLPMTMINDGEVIWDNLKEAELTEDWLMTNLQAQNISTVKDVFYAEWIKGKNLFVVPYAKHK